ncbi:MAG: phosphate acyltransferase PlsX [Planctomycetota bacterium]|nr:phosphate acyltransferase PlsX [Planctomycetota bacterium]
MRIVLDAMGGDHAPAAPVAGALLALEAFADVELVLAGDPAAIETLLAASGAATSSRLTIHDAPEGVGCEDPVKAIRSSSRVSARACAELLRAGEVQGVVTMGSTGAAVAAATLYCRRLAGVKRTGIAVPLPHPNGVACCIDGGANPDAKALNLHQYAVMARHYVRAAFGIENPRIGIVSIGEERHKGNRLVEETWELFEAHPLPNFIGNVEPHAIFEGAVDVAVCDGFTGNIVLKTAEGMAGYIMGSIPKALQAAGVPQDPRKVLGALMSAVDYAQYGGAPLLGVDGAYLIGHGRSGPEAYKNGVGAVRKYILGDVGARIVKQLEATTGSTIDGAAS